MELTTNNEQKLYEIDFDKVSTLEDLKAVIKGLRIIFNESAPAWDELEPYLKELED
jgi:hypothetical protein